MGCTSSTLPNSAEKDKIWPIHLGRYGLDINTKRPDDRDWTGAEIQSCCRLASLLDLPLTEAAKNVVPIAVTAAESVERLRAWAAGRCLDASRSGIYVPGTPAEPAYAKPPGQPIISQLANSTPAHLDGPPVERRFPAFLGPFPGLSHPQTGPGVPPLRAFWQAMWLQVPSTASFGAQFCP